MRIQLLDLVSGLASALDLISPAVAGHHRRVAAIATALGVRLGLSASELEDLRLAGLLHDVGAFTLKSRLDALQFDTLDEGHAETGWRLLRPAPGLERAARLVRRHHTRFDEFGDIPEEPRMLFLGNVLNLADRVDVYLRRDRDLAAEAAQALKATRFLAGRSFDPEAVRVLQDTASATSLAPDFWEDAVQDGLCQGPCPSTALEDGQILDFSLTFSQVIDFRSRFTATHSRAVAEVGRALAEMDGFSPDDQGLVLLAGNLHDLGKLAVPGEILEKPGALNLSEAEIMRRHAEIGERVLSSVPGLEDVAEYGGRHHERPNGRGYPQGLTRAELRRPSLLLAVADVFTALLEDRPYRPGMSPAQVRDLLLSLAEAGDLDRDAVRLLLSRQNIVAEIRHLAQHEAQQQFNAFAAA